MSDQDKLWWRALIKTLLFVGINAFVQALWVMMEVAAYGAPRPSSVDTVVGLALAASLYCNLRHHTKIGGT